MSYRDPACDHLLFVVSSAGCPLAGVEPVGLVDWLASRSRSSTTPPDEVCICTVSPAGCCSCRARSSARPNFPGKVRHPLLVEWRAIGNVSGVRGCEHAYVLVCLLLSFGGTANDFGQGVAGDANGNVYLVGTFASTQFVVAGLPSLQLVGASAIFVIKRDANGQNVWARR